MLDISSLTRSAPPAVPQIMSPPRRSESTRARVSETHGPPTGPEGLYAACASCQATVHDWREHLHERATQMQAAGTLFLEYPSACGVCGESVVEVLAEQASSAARN